MIERGHWNCFSSFVTCKVSYSFKVRCKFLILLAKLGTLDPKMSKKRSYVLEKTYSQKLQVFLNRYNLFLSPGIKGLILLSPDDINVFLLLSKKMKFSIKEFFSKCDQIRSKLRIWSHSLKNSFMEYFIFCALCYMEAEPRAILQIHGRNICKNISRKAIF